MISYFTYFFYLSKFSLYSLKKLSINLYNPSKNSQKLSSGNPRKKPQKPAYVMDAP